MSCTPAHHEEKRPMLCLDNLWPLLGGLRTMRGDEFLATVRARSYSLVVENRHRIALPASDRDWNSFLCGEAGRTQTPGGLAWTLETSAVERGWPSQLSLGTEHDLMKRFSASRAVVRQAIRILESRGSMRMRRGRKGGLHLVQSDLSCTTRALATYLQACACSAAELERTAVAANPLFGALDGGNVLFQLYTGTIALFSSQSSLTSLSDGRGVTIAVQLLEAHAPIPKAGAYLGSEAELCERFDSCRSTLRQALRILDDLNLLRVQRGRGGGYWLARPSPIGVIRQVFALLASHHQALQDIVPATWAVNLAHLRLAADRLATLEPAERSRQVRLQASLIERAPEPQRWTLLQQALARHADSTLLETLQFCIVAYQARLGAPAVPYEEIDGELLQAELGIVRALEDCDQSEAERQQRRAQRLLSELLLCNSGVETAAERRL